MQLRDVMSHEIHDIPPEAPIKQAAEQMRSFDIGALPVCERGRVVGMITDRDIAVRAVAEGRDPSQSKVGDAMSRELIYCYEDDTVESAAKLMEEKQIRRLPIMDRNHQLCGIVSLGDLATRNRDERLSGEVLERVSEPKMPHA